MMRIGPIEKVGCRYEQIPLPNKNLPPSPGTKGLRFQRAWDHHTDVAVRIPVISLQIHHKLAYPGGGGVDPSTTQHKCWGWLRVDPDRRFTQLVNQDIAAASSLKPVMAFPTDQDIVARPAKQGD